MMTNGFRSTAMNVLGVQAEIVCPRVTEKSSVISTMRKLYPALDGAGLSPGMKYIGRKKPTAQRRL